MSTETRFNQAEYWIERHKKLKGDPRSVGNVGKSIDDNLKGEENIKRQVGVLAGLLFPTCKTVLDLGCGYGRVANEFLGTGFQYSGIDVSPDAVAQARRDNPKGTFLVTDLNEWTPISSFDVVCAFYVLVHFVDDEKWASFLDRALRSVSADGYFVFADEFPRERRTAAAHVVARPLSDYAAHLSRQGFVFDEQLKAAFLRKSSSGVSERFHFARRQ